MIDYKRWIYSQDIAEWVTCKMPLSLAEQIDCICSAPHRTFAEKLEGLRELKHYHNEKEVRDKMWQIEELSKHIFSDNLTSQYMYRVEIYYQGSWELIQPEMLFMTVPKATAQIRNHIQKAVSEDCLNKDCFYGVIHILEKIVSLCR